MRRRRSAVMVALVAGALALFVTDGFASPLPGARTDWAEVTPGKSNGATRDCHNRAGLLRWKNYMGDWRDAEDKPQGDLSFASASVADDDTGKFVDREASSLVRDWIEGKYPNQVRIAEGPTGALNTTFKFKTEMGEEPEEVFFRYYLRLANDWNQTVQGGKLPGISGTYGVAGWGDRRSDGTNGWSARGAFHPSVPGDNPPGGLHPIGTYCYHADMGGQYGNIWLWQNDYRGFLENNRWYSIQQYLKLNTPGKKDGINRAWVDGRLAFEKSDVRFRQIDKLRIEHVWMNVYHGGTVTSPYDQHPYIDNVVIAKEYIGPMRLSR